MAAAIAVTAFVLLRNGSGKARDGALFGLYLMFTLAAISAAARALDLWEGWVMIAVVALILTVQWLRSRHREESPASRNATDRSFAPSRSFGHVI